LAFNNNHSLTQNAIRDRCDRMVVGFRTPCAISA